MRKTIGDLSIGLAAKNAVRRSIPNLREGSLNDPLGFPLSVTLASLYPVFNEPFDLYWNQTLRAMDYLLAD